MSLLRVCLKTVASAILADVEPWLPARRKNIATENIAGISGRQDAALYGRPGGLPQLFKQTLKPSLFLFAGILIATLCHAHSTNASESASNEGRSGLLCSEFIFEKSPFPECHASTIVETKNGLAAAWFGGTREKNPDVGIWLSRFESGRWTAPVEVVNGVQSATNRYPCWNPVLFQPKTGPLLLFYKVGPTPSSWWGMLTTSDDGGKSWSTPCRLPSGFAGPIKNKPVQLANGDILCPSSSEDEGWRVHFERTKDLGETWEMIGPVNDGKQIGAIQPSILFHKGQALQAVGRTKQAKVFQIWSKDNGQTWGEMTLTDLPNPNSGTDAVTLKDGRHLLVYNHTPKKRSPLNVAVSSNGKEWQAAIVLEDTEGEYSYPAVIQSKDGLVHITYTWKRQRVKHAVINPKKLHLRPISNGAWPN